MNLIDYERLNDVDSSAFTYDTLDVKQKIEKPVVLKECTHPKQCFTFVEAQMSWNSNKQIICPCCNKMTQNFNEIRKDIRSQIYQQFHQSVEYVQVIQGIFTHKYNRKKRFTDYIQAANQKVPEFLQGMKKRFHQSNSISSIIQAQSANQEQVIFWAYCLLDKVKITTPVRLIKCDHPECYELTSLLAYQGQQEGQDADKKGVFECCHPGCSNSINITTLQELINCLILDVDLLKIMNLSLPCQFKFIYLPKKKQFDLQQANAQDPMIEKIYKNLLTEDEKKLVNLNSFITQVQNLTVTVMQQEITPTQEKIFKQEMFKIKTIDMVDPLTQEFIEFPVRCTQCTSYDRCVDIRSFAASHIIAKQRKQIDNSCPLCKGQYKCLGGTLTSGIVYFDQNILSKMFKDMSYQQTKIFKYDGRQYMLEQFYNSQKLSKEGYLKDLKEKTNDTVGEFSPQQCSCNPKRQIEIPLIIKDCPEKTMIDFDTFYEMMIEINFNIEKDGLNLCKCNNCNFKPIKSYIKSLFYHEALGEAMAAYKKCNIKVKSFKYDFKTQKVIMKLKQDDATLDQTLRIKAKFQNGFLDMMDDAEYQELFQPKYFGGKLFQIIGMQQTIVDGVVIEHNQKGIKANLDENIRNLNQNANSNLRQYKFQVTGMQVELNNEDIRLNRGTFGVQK